MKLTSIEIISFFSIYLYNLFLINYYGKIAKFKLNKRVILILVPIMTTLIYWSMITRLIFPSIIYIMSLIWYIFVFKIIFDITVSSAYILSICQIFQIISNRDIIIGIITLVYKSSMYEAIQHYDTYVITYSLSNLMLLIITAIFNREAYINKIELLLIYRKKVVLSILTITSLIIILLNSNYVYYYSGGIHSKTIIMLSSRMCTYFCFCFAIGMAFKSIKWVEEEVFYKTNLLNLEHKEAMSKKVEEYSELLKIYNHDFKNVLLNIKDSIDIGDNEKAKYIIEEFSENIYHLTNYNKKFSNNDLINALLNRINNICINKNINFDCDCYIPNEFNISELELINIFNNLSSNAIEACDKQSDEENKWINFKSYVKDNNLVIYQTNSFNGSIKFRNDKLITTKEDKKNHGIGVESIKYIINKVEGMYLIKVDEEKKEFKFLIKIPLKIF